MELTKLRLALRPRRPQEAMDLGVRLVQDEWRLVYRCWFLITLPLLALTLLLTVLTESAYSSLLLWWLKPVADYAVLIVLSRRVFGETPSTGNLLRVWLGSWRQGLPGFLLLRRLSMSRAFAMPVWLLEGLPARERRSRLALLRHAYTGRARWMQLVFLHFELALYASLIGLMVWLYPSHDWNHVLDLLTDGSSLTATLIATLLYYLAMTLVEPFYVSAGFALYLNRRTELEAWDVELAFRQMRERLESLQGGLRHGES